MSQHRAKALRTKHTAHSSSADAVPQADRFMRALMPSINAFSSALSDLRCVLSAAMVAYCSRSLPSAAAALSRDSCSCSVIAVSFSFLAASSLI